MLKTSFFFPILFLLTVSCKALPQTDTLKAEAVVRKGIPVAADGCGDMIEIDSVLYKVKDLPEEFLKEGLKVKISYIQLPPYKCGRAGKEIPFIQIVSIKALGKP